MSDFITQISRFATRRPLAVLAALTLFAALSAEAQSSVNERRPYSGRVVNPCNNETVNFSGSIHFQEKTKVADDGRIHFIAHTNFSASGVGESTQLHYSLGGTLQSNAKFPSFPILFRQRTKVVSSGASDNFHVTFVFHVNGNGEQTRALTEADCKG